MRASPFAEIDNEATAKSEALKGRVRSFAAERPLKGLTQVDESDEQETTYPWDETPSGDDA